METLDPPQIHALQLLKLRRIVSWAAAHSPFYREKFADAGFEPSQLQDLKDVARLPLTDKSEWLKAQGDEPVSYGKMIAVADEEVVRYHQTSGTTGEPIRLGFNHRDWQMWLQCWGYGLAACNLTAQDRILVCFPFNLFVGWWGGQDAARLLGSRVYSGGGMSSLQRLQLVCDHQITVLMGAPSYLLRLAKIGREELKLDISRLEVRALVCGAEPGGSIPATRKRLEDAWDAEVFDHLGASEVGPWGYECPAHPGGVHICENYFLLEFLHPETFEPTQPGELSRIVITSLEKYTQPVIRWDLKDLARLSEEPCSCGRTFRWVKGGILGRADDLIKVRGVLFSPRAVEDVIRSFEEVSEYQVRVFRCNALDELTLRCEASCVGEAADRLVQDLTSTLRLKTHLRFNVELCPPGTLPRQEIKTQRVIDQRDSP